MFKPVPMVRLSLVVLERDERPVLRYLGQAGLVQLTRTVAGPDTAPLAPRDRSQDAVRCDRLLARMENLRRSLELPPAAEPVEPAALPLEEAEAKLGLMEEQSGALLKRRQHLMQQWGELTDVCEQMSGYRGLEIPLDQPEPSSFLHFVTGSLPSENLERLRVGDNVALLPLPPQNGRQPLIALTTRRGRAALEAALQQAGFQPETLPAVEGATVDTFSEKSRRQKEQVARELGQANAEWQTLAGEYAGPLAELRQLVSQERRLLDAEQNFPRTETAVLLTGWVPTAAAPPLAQRLREITGERYVLQTTTPENLAEEQIPVLLRHSRLLRPFEMLVTAYGLPRYRELEPTWLVAVSYLLMFGMMFGDVGHGFVLACGGLAILLRSRKAQWRDAGLLLLLCGLASIGFGAAYGSYFGLPQLKRFAFWHDPLEGDPMAFMSIAIGIGIVLMSLGMALNVINHFRRGHVLGGFLDKFGVAGVVFYWGALALVLKYTVFESYNLVTLAVLLFLAAPVMAWVLKEPIELLRRRVEPASVSGNNLPGAILQSLVEVFEAVLAYLSNTISFVRLAAYAMSHSALLLAAFMMAEQVRHLSFGGGLLSVLVIILGNLLSLVLEGIVAAVQALRLEYYEFFSKFFSGSGQPFKPFRLVAEPQTG
ncbi:MAG TPA: V-type ATPase 116kDa subunit family protein [Verrucomicrobiae bacterium]|nr:V-type ATPase 116kDa subunit family protein [Verrucomicrobiae bacterium]